MDEFTRNKVTMLETMRHAGQAGSRIKKIQKNDGTDHQKKHGGEPPGKRNAPHTIKGQAAREVIMTEMQQRDSKRRAARAAN